MELSLIRFTRNLLVLFFVALYALSVVGYEENMFNDNLHTVSGRQDTKPQLKWVNLDDISGVTAKQGFVELVDNTNQNTIKSCPYKQHIINKQLDYPKEIFIAEYTFSEIASNYNLSCNTTRTTLDDVEQCEHQNNSSTSKYPAEDFNELFTQDFFLTSAQVLLPCWWITDNQSTSWPSSSPSHVSSRGRPSFPSTLDTPFSPSLNAASHQDKHTIQRKSLAALIVDQSLFEGPEAASEVQHLFGHWYYDWFRWMEQNKKWDFDFIEKHYDKFGNSKIDELKQVLDHFSTHTFKTETDPIFSAMETTNQTAFSLSEDGHESTVNRNNSVNDENDQFMKNPFGNDVLKLSTFYDEHNLPDDLWPGKMSQAGSTLKQQVTMARSFYSKTYVPKPIVSIATYDIDSCIKSDEIDRHYKQKTQMNGLPLKSSYNRFQCYTLLDVSALIKTWLKRISPWRRKTAKMSVMFYIVDSYGKTNNDNDAESVKVKTVLNHSNRNSSEREGKLDLSHETLVHSNNSTSTNIKMTDNSAQIDNDIMNSKGGSISGHSHPSTAAPSGADACFGVADALTETLLVSDQAQLHLQYRMEGQFKMLLRASNICNKDRGSVVKCLRLLIDLNLNIIVLYLVI